MHDNNPYASPQSQVLEAQTASEDTRKLHLNYEANVKALGSLYYLYFSIFAFAFILALLGDVEPALSEGLPLSQGMWIASLAFLSVGFFLFARGLRTFKPWSRIVAIVLSVLGLLAFPLGTLINLAVLYLLLSRKGSFVFTAEYQAVIADTPQIKYKTSIIVWIFVGLLALILLLIIFASIFGAG